MRKVEYRVRPVMRYVVTRYMNDDSSAGSEVYGEFDNEVLASNAVLAFGDSDAQEEQAAGHAIDEVITRRPMNGFEQVRTWRWREGWDDRATAAEEALKAP